jgi:RNA polymerase sigma factor (sigma-70 family)
MRLARMMRSISRSSINSPSALRRSRRTLIGERSRYRERNRDSAARYQDGASHGYTSCVPEPMRADIETAANDRVAAAYDAYYDLLRFIARQRFHIPDPDVRPLIHDVFVAFIRHEHRIDDDRRWLTQAVVNACLNHRRDAKPTSPLPDELLDPRRVVDDALAKHDVALLLKGLSERCRRVLRMRYVEGLEPAEIATCLATTPGFVRVKVHRCLAAARRALTERP